MESPTDVGATNAITSDGRVSLADREQLNVQQSGLWEDSVVECIGGAVDSPRAHGVLRPSCEISLAHVACQTRVSTTTTTASLKTDNNLELLGRRINSQF